MPSIPIPRLSFLFGLFFVSIVSSKLVRLYIHITTVPVLAFAFYLPTFFIFDLIVICFARLILQPAKNSVTFLASVIGGLFAVLSLAGASSELGFFFKTGGEIDWRDASTYTSSKDAFEVLLSGSIAVILSSCVLVVITWFSHNILYQVMGAFLAWIGHEIASGWNRVRMLAPIRRGKYTHLKDIDDSESIYQQLPTHSVDDDAETSPFGRAHARPPSRCYFSPSLLSSWVVKAVTLAFLVAALVVRPAKPYNSMSVTLPVSLFDAFRARTHFCRDQKRIMENKWPFPKLLRKSRWEDPEGDFKGWAPGPKSKLAARYRDRIPDWFPTTSVPRGFFRWDPERFTNPPFGSFLPTTSISMPPPHEPHQTPHSRRSGAANNPPPAPSQPSPTSAPPPTSPTSSSPLHRRYDYSNGRKGPTDVERNQCPELSDSNPFYNPVSDPLKITNLDSDILQPLKEALDNGSVKIRHVVLILMESLREELFPLRQGSDLYNTILEHNDEKDRDQVEAQLARLTPHIERMITGRSGNLTSANGSTLEFPELKWNDTTRPDFGGVNVVGAYTSATMSTKSFGATHCGAWPMPVDTFDEADTDSYQPCLPQIFELFGRGKGAASNHSSSSRGASPDRFQNQPWYPALFEAQIEEYDRQEVFDRKLGFKHIVTRAQLESDWRYNSSDPLYHKVNYFAYPEPVLKPYLKEYITDALANKRRMFLSHFTSTTHHAWDTPDDFDVVSYLPSTGFTSSWHKDFNKYLNTIRYHDAWMGELLQMFDDLGIADETLVVFAGDHGQAFQEDHHKTGTYENGHVSNFRIPITFRHPHLPRVQYEANATSISILPTVLDLLVHSGSLDDEDARIASDILHDYEGQSLIRPYKASHNGRRAWNFAVVNSGGGMLAVTSADAPWRLVMPLEGRAYEYRVTDLSKDPRELGPVKSWSVDEAVKAVGEEMGQEAAQWLSEAVPVARWWSLERRRLWRHNAV
ncbi:alkaline phosphatase-like protein [Sodiomyces alkalinus F11]|uniref:Alkaline phosphatase-like protein n=1 Tax=Sodiomyces alkalinus (strain CBS 110278 / VKM F-3762 / F11) TaxID=1314773 RepID=A0A3N2PPR5_SODAK|nr:alkaline phosphatase-like protein [Sodiomyces alkalinus F11]ROT36495.1 alkaline phosphatase-like protein [Sodiomyces alkalinus F11]